MFDNASSKITKNNNTAINKTSVKHIALGEIVE